MLLLAILTFSATGIHAGEDPGYSVEVGFITFNGHSRKVEIPLTEKQGQRLRFFPRESQEFIDEAKRVYADKLGFSRRMYGKDAWKVVPGLRVDYADLNLPDGQTVELR